jgi:hypothetical protein
MVLAHGRGFAALAGFYCPLFFKIEGAVWLVIFRLQPAIANPWILSSGHSRGNANFPI